MDADKCLFQEIQMNLYIFNSKAFIRFILKLSILLFPFLILAIYTISTFTKNANDICKMAMICAKKSYHEQFETLPSQFYKDFDTEDFIKNKSKLLIIGDSFSEAPFSFQNYLTEFNSHNFPKAFQEKLGFHNQFNFLINLVHSGFLKQHSYEYLVLQIVGRDLTTKSENINWNKREKNIDIYSKISQQKSENTKITLSEILRYPYRKARYYFNPKSFSSNVYYQELQKNLFSNSEKKLFYFKNDLDNIKTITPQSVKTLNKNLNKLSNLLKQQGTQLVLLIAPDKYDVYYDHISFPSKKENPLFNLIRSKLKDYLFVDLKATFTKQLDDNLQDLYLSDNTHWSSIGAKIAA